MVEYIEKELLEFERTIDSIKSSNPNGDYDIDVILDTIKKRIKENTETAEKVYKDHCKLTQRSFFDV